MFSSTSRLTGRWVHCRSVVAAVGLVLVMVGAVITRIRRREAKVIVVDLAYLALAGFVAWGRFGPESFTV